MRSVWPWLVAAGLAASHVGWAQCASNASSCVTCHETQGAHPVLGDAHRWHVDHGYGDLCASCHGGDSSAAAATAAHVGLRDPLATSATSCGGCHADAEARAQRYRTLRGTPMATPAPTAPATTPRTAPAPASNRATLGLTALAMFLAAALAGLVLRDRRALPAFAPMRWARAKLWSPYAAGAMLGLVVAVSQSVLGRPVAASGAFDRLAAGPGHWLYPRDAYFAQFAHAGLGWPVWVVVGVLLGSFAAARLSDEAHLRALPDTLWIPRYGARRGKRALIAFVGAALVQFGADVAGGCTSGLAISGGAVLAPGAFIFMAGMFLGGIPTARWWHRRRP